MVLLLFDHLNLSRHFVMNQLQCIVFTQTWPDLTGFLNMYYHTQRTSHVCTFQMFLWSCWLKWKQIWMRNGSQIFAKNNMIFFFRHQDNKNLKFFVTVLKNKMFVGKNDTKQQQRLSWEIQNQIKPGVTSLNVIVSFKKNGGDNIFGHFLFIHVAQ